MNPKKKRRATGIIIFVLAIALLGGTCLYGLHELKDVKGTVSSLKSNVRGVISALTSGKTDEAGYVADRLDEDVSALQTKFDNPLFKLLGILPVVGKDVDSAEKLCAALDEMTDTLIRPTIAFLEENPLSELKTENGINTAAADRFLAFYQQLVPALEKVTAELGGMNLTVIDQDGKINAYLDALGQLSDILGVVNTDVIGPLRTQLAVCPLDDIKVGEGFNIRIINSYLDFLDGFIPNCRNLTDKLEKLNLGELDKKGSVAEYTAALQRLIDMYDNNHEYIDLVRAFTGDGSDRAYLIGAQNSAEIYASGGFPGSMGMITIEDGVLSIGQFKSVYDTIIGSFGYRDEEKPTYEEQHLFPGLCGYPWDAGYCPDFERVAQIWSGSYQRRHNAELDGILSLTPVVIGRLLPLIGEIELSDGTVLTGDDATVFLQFEIYNKYNNEFSYDFRGDDYCDMLFAEVAQKAMKGLVKSFNITHIPEYIRMLEESIADRSLMLWFRDANEQSIARALHCDGSLHREADDPQIGIFVSVVDACKMGWWVDLDYELSEPTVNEDGSRSYELTVYAGNGMTYGERGNYSGYITGGGYGSVVLQTVITGPAGGSMENCDSHGYYGYDSMYGNLPIFDVQDYVSPQDQIVMSCTVTTAPGVDKEPEIVMTPTLTEYRLAYLESLEP